MTFRSIVVGLCSAAFICGFTFFNNCVINQTNLTGNNMPIYVYGGLILVVLALNPILIRLSRRWAFSGKELAVIIALTLAACTIPAEGLMWTFPNALILPYHYNDTIPGWKEQGVIELCPPQMLVDVGTNDSEVLNGYVQGMGSGSKHISWSQVPWHAWVRPLRFWLPILITFWIALIGLSLVVHKHWSEHESLPYPIAEFSNLLLPRKDTTQDSIFRNKLFWIGAGSVFLLHANNYLCEWFPNHLIRIPTSFDFRGLTPVFPNVGPLLELKLYFSVIGISYFLAKDVSLSLGIAPLVYASIAGTLARYGIPLGASIEGTTGYMDVKICRFLNAGAYLGTFLTLWYTGRRYYSSVFRQAVFTATADDGARDAVFGARVFLVFITIFLAQLIAAGLDWQLSVIYTIVAVILFMVMGRIIAETGLFFMEPYVFPCVVMWGLLGTKALGPQTLLIMFVFSTVLLVDPLQAIVPVMMNAFKGLELQRVNIRKTSMYCVVALLVGLTIAIGATLYLQYDRGATMDPLWDWSGDQAPTMAYNNVLQIKERLTAQGLLDQASHLSGWQRFRAVSPHASCVAGLCAGVFLVVLFSKLRLTFPKWPLHPVMFLVWDTYPMQFFLASFLTGWFVKIMIVRYGGSKVYHNLKPCMVGLIAGEFLAAILFVIIGTAYFFITGHSPKLFRIIPCFI